MNKTRQYYEQLADKIQKENLFINYTDLSYEMILNEILNGNITSEDIIMQEQFSILLNLSRTPVRDALLRLEREGYLVRNEKGSFKLYNGSLSDYMDFSEMRIVIEPKMAALAARRASEEQLQELRNNVDALYRFIEHADILKIMELDYNFHYLIAQASGNVYLQELLKKYRIKMTFNFRFVVRKESVKKLYRVHNDIYQAIEKGDDDLAEKMMYKHLQFYMDNVRAYF